MIGAAVAYLLAAVTAVGAPDGGGKKTPDSAEGNRAFLSVEWTSDGTAVALGDQWLLDVGTVDNYATGPVNTLTIQNTGGESVTSLVISVSQPDYLIPPGGQHCGPTIAAGSFCTVDVQFRPRSSIAERAALTATGLTDGTQAKSVGQLLGHPRLPTPVAGRAVYEAVHVDLGKPVALKTPPPGGAGRVGK
jgi:hypothetical protein